MTRSKEIQAILDKASVDRVWAHMEWMSSEVPERISGWAAARTQSDYLTEQLRAYGYDAQQDTFPALVSYPRGGALRLLHPRRYTIEGMTFAHSTSTPETGLEGEVVYVGAGGEDDYAGKDVRGKIVVAELSYAPPRPEKTRIATERGAIGLVLINWGEDDNPSIPMGTIKSVWGNPTIDNIDEMPDLPAIGISRAEGITLREELLQGTEVRASIIADADREWRTMYQPHGILGAGASRDWILLADHLDSWGGGATDNTSGNAVTLEVARILAEHRDALHRDVRVAFWEAHEAGIMEGSTWYVDHYWDAINEGLIGYINIDSAGMKHADKYEAELSPELWTFHREVMQDALGYVTAPRRLNKYGDQSFLGVGAAAVFGRSVFPEELVKQWNGAILGPWYQSTDDTMAVVDKDVLAQDLRISLAYAWALATRPVLPYDFRDPMRILRKTLEGYIRDSDSTVDLETPLRLAEELEAAAGTIHHISSALSEKFDANGDSRDLQDEAAHVNEGLKQLSRMISPVLSTVVGRYGQDTYGLSVLRHWIPSLADLRQLKDRDPLSGEHALYWGKAVRARNRLTDALTDALRTADILIQTHRPKAE